MTTSERITDHAGHTAPARSTQAAPRVRTGLWVGLGLAAGAAALLLSFVAHRVPYFADDIRITRVVQTTDLRLLAPALNVLNALGFPPLVILVYGSVLAMVFVSGHRWEAAVGGFGILGGAGINAALKHLVDRPRPSPLLVHVQHHIANPSYPAGHVLNFTAFAGFLCCLLYLRMRLTWQRGFLVGLGVVMMALMGVARIDSGEHWPSDVLGGYLLGMSWLAVLVLLYESGRRRFPVLRTGRRAGAPARGLFIAATIGSSLGLVGGAHAAPIYPDSLGATTEVPWNPPHAMARRQGWEQAVLLPGRVLSLPLVGLGRATERTLLFLEQDPRVALGSPRSKRSGGPIVLKTAWLGDRAGLEGGIEAHQNLLTGAFASRLSAEYDATIHFYNRTLVTWSGRPLSFQYEYDWRPEDRFYGIGNTSPLDHMSDYASQSEYVRGNVGWGSDRKFDPAHPHATLRFWGGPRSQITSTGRQPGAVSYETRFPALGVATLDRRVEHLIYGGSLQLDHRTGSPHWSRGWRTLVSAERFDLPVHAIALHSGANPGVAFTRYQAEAEAGLSFMRDPRTLRLLVHMTDQQSGADPGLMLVSDLPSLGGQAGLGGFDSGRFHDMDLLLTRLSYVFPLERHLEVNLHAEWGAVYSDLWHDAKFNTLHDSFGFALRGRDDNIPRGSIGFDFSREAIRLRFSFGGVE